MAAGGCAARASSRPGARRPTRAVRRRVARRPRRRAAPQPQGALAQRPCRGAGRRRGPEATRSPATVTRPPPASRGTTGGATPSGRHCRNGTSPAAEALSTAATNRWRRPPGRGGEGGRDRRTRTAPGGRPQGPACYASTRSSSATCRRAAISSSTMLSSSTRFASSSGRVPRR